MIEVLQEITDWDMPNGIYHVNSAGELVAFKGLKTELKTFKNPLKRFSKARRKFKLISTYQDDIDWENSTIIKGSNGNTYIIRDGKCSCPGFKYRRTCKHINEN